MANDVQQSGTVTPGHYAIWTADGVIQDGGASPPTNTTGPYIEQSGGVTPTHLAVWTYDGVIQDGGPLPNGLTGWVFRQGPFTGSTNSITLVAGTTTLFCDTRSGVVGIQLPAPTSSKVCIVNVVDEYGNAAVHQITISVTGGTLIKNQATYVLTTDYESFSAVDSGSVWSPI